MARILRFVDLEFSKTGGDGSPPEGEILLDLISDDYCMDIEFDIPSPTIEWRDPAHLNGREVSRFKYPNIEVHVTGHVYGTTKADLSANIRALFEQFNASNPILEWRPEGWADSLFIDLIDPPIDIDVSDWFEAKLRDNPYINVLANIDVHCEAKPFGRRPEETLWICRNLGPDDGFEEWTGVALDYWDITEVLGGTVTENNAAELDGFACVQLDTAGGVDSAAVTDKDFIPVDNERHYNCRVYADRLSAADAVSFDVDILCYNDVPALLGTLNLLVNDNCLTVYEDPVEKGPATGVVHPTSEADVYSFPAGTTQIKRRFTNDSAIASSMVIDFAYFGDSEYFTRPGSFAGSGLDPHRVENPATISIPPADILGDVPAPARLYLDGQYILAGVDFDLVFMNKGFRSSYDTTPVLVLKPTGGAQTIIANYLDQYYETYATGVGAININFETGIPIVGECRGRFHPVVKATFDTVTPQYIDMHLEARLYETTTPVALTDWQQITEDARWESTSAVIPLASGYYQAANIYFENFDTISIPHVEVPDIADDGNIVMELRLEATASQAATNLDIDYLALIPIEQGYCFSNYITGSMFINFDGVSGQLVASEDVDRVMSFVVPLGEVVGALDQTVDPKGMNGVILATASGAVRQFATHPFHRIDARLIYSPLYLLVSEG